MKKIELATYNQIIFTSKIVKSVNKKVKQINLPGSINGMINFGD